MTEEKENNLLQLPPIMIQYPLKQKRYSSEGDLHGKRLL